MSSGQNLFALVHERLCFAHLHQFFHHIFDLLLHREMFVKLQVFLAGERSTTKGMSDIFEHLSTDDASDSVERNYKREKGTESMRQSN
jgi:hypothetical protein